MSRRFYPTERDRQITAAVYTHRALTTDHISLLFWGQLTATSRCRHRLKLLSEHGYLERAEQPVTLAQGRKPLVYFLSRAGAEVASEELEIELEAIDWKRSYNNVKWPFLEHLLFTNDIRVRVEYAAPKAGLNLVEWVDDKSLASLSIKDAIVITTPTGKRERSTVGPDGYFALEAPGSSTLHRAFVEADRATVPLSRWGEKVGKYLAYFRSKQFRERYRARKPFRVLTVTTTEARLENMKQATEAAGGKSWFWFTTYEAIADPDQLLFAPVWHMAGSDRNVAFPYPPK